MSNLAAPDQPGKQLEKLRDMVIPSASYAKQLGWLRHWKSLRPHLQSLRPLRVAIMGNGTLEYLADAVSLWLGLEGFAAEIYLCSYNSFHQEILDPSSAFYGFKPDIVWLLASQRDMAFENVATGATVDLCKKAVAAAVEQWHSCWRQLRSVAPFTIIQNNIDEPSRRVFGHFEAMAPWSRSSLIHQFNEDLAEYARKETVTIFDLNYVASGFGLTRWCEERHWHQSKQPFNPDAYGTIAFHFARLVGSIQGSAKKCVVLDLDNTLWGGVLGDDGIEGIRLGEGIEGEAYASFQDYLKQLLQRGILLAVCSKNDQAVAEEAFRKHPDMRLKLDDISCFVANWENKADNIRKIATQLNVGLDALVFVDDNPSERALIRSEVPEVTVVSLPEDPSGYAAALSAGCYFETTSFSAEDIARVRLYRENAQREIALGTATDLHSFLRDLEMEATIGRADSFHLPRMAQLLAKTNQFHVTTTRLTAAELQALDASPSVWLRRVSLRDKFGDHGLISVAILQPEIPDQFESLFISTWAMSCRVFSRGLEEFILEQMTCAARELGAKRIVGIYKPTAKNRPVADLYKRLGFTLQSEEEAGSKWVLELALDLSFKHFIRSTEAQNSQCAANGR
jgi:FkbH-like protein